MGYLVWPMSVLTAALRYSVYPSWYSMDRTIGVSGFVVQ
jgi:hypothetical protein